MDILYLRNDPVETHLAGGAYAHTTGVIKGFMAHNARVVFAGYMNLPLTHQHLKCIRLQAPPMIPSTSVRRMMAGFQPAHRVRRLLPSYSWSFLYHRYSLNDCLPLRLARSLGIPCVTEYNGSEVWIARKWSGSRSPLLFVSSIIEKQILKHTDALVTVSKPLADELKKIGADAGRILVNPNGFDDELFTQENDCRAVREKYEIPLDAVVVTYVGSFAPFHGVEILAKAAGTAVRRGNSNLFFLFVGEGKMRAEVEDIIRSEGLVKRTLFTGLVPPEEAARLMKASDILVASHVFREGDEFFGSPTKLFEYMASGRAVIASAIGQIKEIIRDGENGRLVPSGNEKVLADVILELANDINERTKLGGNARKEAFNLYTWKAHARRTLDFLRSLGLI